jgi:cobalt-zinc-cadmium efflux system outer membrane protein
MSLRIYLLAGLLLCHASGTWAAMAPYAQPQLQIKPAGSKQPANVPLQQFIQQVWEKSPAVQAAQAAIDAAQARARGAGRALHNPSLELEAERSDINTTTVGISQTIDWSGKQDVVSQSALIDVQAAKANLTSERQQVAVKTLAVLADVLAAQDQRDLALMRSQLMKRFVDTVSRRFEAGDISSLDRVLAKVAYSEALIQQATSEGALAEARAILVAETGLSADAWPKLPQTLAPPPEQYQAGELLNRLPALQAQQLHWQQAKQEIRMAKRLGRADPTIGIRGGREGSENLLGLSLEIPLFVRNSFSAEVEAASSQSIEAEFTYRNAYQMAKAKLDSAWGRFHHASRAVKAWALTGQAAHAEQAQLIEQFWKSGELSASDYLIQAKQNIDTHSAAVSLIAEVWRAHFAWLEASGQVEQWLGLAANAAIETSDSGVSQ